MPDSLLTGEAAHARLCEAFDALCDASPAEQAAGVAALRARDAGLGQALADLLALDDDAEVTGWLAGGVAVVIEPPNPLVARLDAARPDAPVRLGDLAVFDRLGAGGMGAVYAARPTDGGPAVAIKTLHRLSPKAIQRLKAEFRVVRAIVHPHVVTPHALLHIEGSWCLRLPLVPGTDWLTHVAPQGPEPGVGDRLRATVPALCAGLQALHAAGVLHLDVKPGNVRVTPAGQVKLLDFGIAHAARAERTPAEGISGTPAYMAP
ncbi:MAG: protein kinase, partial [Myxococcales bacterium]|nr:protein kinase [Myxococcales bacterium]